MLDMSMGQRAKWLADEQWEGRGKVVLCGMCESSGFDPDDPSDYCPACRGVGATLRTDLRPDPPVREPAAEEERLPVETTVRRWMRAFLS